MFFVASIAFVAELKYGYTGLSSNIQFLRYHGEAINNAVNPKITLEIRIVFRFVERLCHRIHTPITIRVPTAKYLLPIAKPVKIPDMTNQRRKLHSDHKIIVNWGENFYFFTRLRDTESYTITGIIGIPRSIAAAIQPPFEPI